MMKSGPSFAMFAVATTAAITGMGNASIAQPRVDQLEAPMVRLLDLGKSSDNMILLFGIVVPRSSAGATQTPSTPPPSSTPQPPTPVTIPPEMTETVACPAKVTFGLVPQNTGTDIPYKAQLERPWFYNFGITGIPVRVQLSSNQPTDTLDCIYEQSQMDGTPIPNSHLTVPIRVPTFVAHDSCVVGPDNKSFRCKPGSVTYGPW
jgi:hypothetical protein